MNLIHDSWLRAVNKYRTATPISPAEMVNPEWLDILLPRPDFKGAIYQLLIGLLQTCFAPDDLEDWVKWWKSPPDSDTLLQAFSNCHAAFELKNNNAPAFMQDLTLENGEICNIAELLIESPGGLTIKENRDHFIKRGKIEKVCPTCAAISLFTLQINAPSGGQGHRVGLRGGGPLTTLVLPSEPTATLWQRLWLNVLPLSHQSFREKDNLWEQKDIFPWLAPTRTSDSKGVITCPEHTHPFQVYWAMPRRIRLNFNNLMTGLCDLCGTENHELLSSYFSKNYGINYAGTWEHPLTPYRHDAKAKNPPLSIKGQMGGIGYRHWLGLALGNQKKLEYPAAVVSNYHEKIAEMEEPLHYPQLWCFGYDMDNMKARCWYENQLPLFNFNRDRITFLQFEVNELLIVAREALTLLKKYTKAAWYSVEPNKNLDFSFLESQFWEKSEHKFYDCLKEIINNDRPIMQIDEIWLNKITSITLFLFDALTLTALPKEMQRIVPARNNLKKWLSYSTPIKDLWKKINANCTQVVKENKETI
jgi:CRISPR system Cascade subunit CasA